MGLLTWLLPFLLLQTPMPETPIYGPQYFLTTDGTINRSAGWRSTTFGGANTPIAGFPEIASMEFIKNTSGVGAGGEDGLDQFSAGDNYWKVGMQLLNIVTAPLGNPAAALGDYFDTRIEDGALHIRVSCKLLTNLFSSNSYFAPITLVAEAGGGQSQVNSGWVAQVEIYQSSGTNFQWNIGYYHKNPSSSSFQRVDVNGSLALAADTLDGAVHTVEIVLVPATVTGAFNGSGQVGSATIAHDGSIALLIDDVLVLSDDNIDIVVNRFATTNPLVYYAYGIWLGDGGAGSGADMAGPTTGIYLFYDAPIPLPPDPDEIDLINSLPCCSCSTSPERGGDTTATPSQGRVLPPLDATWESDCDPGGIPPTAADLTLTELWDF